MERIADADHPRNGQLAFWLMAAPLMVFLGAMMTAGLLYPKSPMPYLSLAYREGCVVEIRPRYGPIVLDIEGRTFCLGQDHPVDLAELRTEIVAAIDLRRSRCIQRIEASPVWLRQAGWTLGPASKPENVCGPTSAQWTIKGL